MPLEDDYVAALVPLARAFGSYAKVTGHPAVLVGGAATAIYTDGAFLSGDFDVVASLTSAFDDAMLAEGFIQEDRSGYLHVGFYHPYHPRFGYQQVSKPLFDGMSDTGRLLRVEVTADGDAVTLPSVEDMIADRLGQYAAGSATDMSRLQQARTLFKLATDLDMSYLLRRISDEQGDATLLEA